jgi:hypothetical protein
MEVKIINNPHKKSNFSIADKLKESDDFLIQFDKIVSTDYLKSLNEIIKNKNVQIRFYSYDGLWKNLDFLMHLNNLKNLVIDEPYLTDIISLSKLNFIEKLSLGSTDNKIDLSPICDLDLISLLIEKNTLGLESVLKSQNLEDLHLWNLNHNNLKAIGNRTFQNFSINNVKLKSYDFFQQINVVNELNVFSIKSLLDVKFINDYNQLKIINLGYLPKIKELFDFNNLKDLNNLSLDNLKNIETLNNIDKSNLKTIYIYDCNKLEKNEIEKINPSVLSEIY